MLKGLATLAITLTFAARVPLLSQEGEKTAMELRADGLAFSRAGQTGQAVDAYLAAIAADPSRESLYLELTDILLGAGVPDDASSILQRARRMFRDSKLPEYNSLYYRLANGYISAGRFGPAADAMKEAAGIKGEVPLDTIYKKLGDLRADLLEFEGADAAYKRALTLNPGNLSVHLALGSLDIRRNRLDDALAEYQRVESAAPRNAAALSGLAEVYFRLGRFADAASEAARAIPLDPSGRSARYVRGQALLRLGQVDEGKSELQEYQSLQEQAEALNLKSGDIYALYSGGMARIVKGDYAGGIAIFRQGVESHPDEKKFYLALGAALGQAGQHSDAADTYGKAIERFGEEPQFRQGYDRETKAAQNAQPLP